MSGKNVCAKALVLTAIATIAPRAPAQTAAASPARGEVTIISHSDAEAPRDRGSARLASSADTVAYWSPPPLLVMSGAAAPGFSQGTATSSRPQPARAESKTSEVEENPSKHYYFIGARYRANVIPAFLLNAFAREAPTIVSNTVGIELDSRKDGFSIIPAISYTEYGTGDLLLADRSRDSALPQNWWLVNSSLKGIYATADLMWSTALHKNVAFEYGMGFGIGYIYGDLVTNWVRDDPNGPLAASSGRRFAACRTVNDGPGCRPIEHEGGGPARVNNYVEKSWLDGGSRPSFFPWISIPQIGVRVKAAKQFEARVTTGLALTGFWFGISANYGLQ